MAGTYDDKLNKLLQESLQNGLLYAPSGYAERRALERRAEAGMIASPFKGLYAPTEEWRAMQAARRYRTLLSSIARIHPNWVFCSFSAASIHGLEIAITNMNKVHIASTSSRTNGMVVRHHLRGITPVQVGNIACAPLESTMIDCIRECDFRCALAIADSALRAASASVRDVTRNVLEMCRSSNAREYAVDVLSYADGRAENGGESYARAVMIEQGVMVPQLQVEHYDPITQTRYRDDFEWNLASGRVAGELDGKQKYESIALEQGRTIDDVILAERQRESRLRNQGIRFARFTFDQVRRVAPFLEIIDMCGIPRIGENHRIPRLVK